MCVRERETVTLQHISLMCVFVCVWSVCVCVCVCVVCLCVCVWSVCVSVCLSVCVCEGVRDGRTVTSQRSLQPVRNLNHGSVTRLCSPLGLELMVKLRTLLTVFTFILKAKARDYGKGRYISDECLWCSANLNALCQLANQSRLRLSEGGTFFRKQSV